MLFQTINTMQAEPSDRFVAWYDIAYSGPQLFIKLKTTIISPDGLEISDPLGDPGLLMTDDLPEHTGWVGNEFQIPATAPSGLYDVKCSL